MYHIEQIWNIMLMTHIDAAQSAHKHAIHTHTHTHGRRCRQSCVYINICYGFENYMMYILYGCNVGRLDAGDTHMMSVVRSFGEALKGDKDFVRVRRGKGKYFYVYECTYRIIK